MGYFDYSREPKSDIAFVDMKSFYASVECVERGLHPLKTSLCVMSRAENANGLILASSPIFKQVFGKSNVSRSYDLPFDIPPIIMAIISLGAVISLWTRRALDNC